MKNYKEISDGDISKIAKNKTIDRFDVDSTVDKVKCINKVLRKICQFGRINAVMHLLVVICHAVDSENMEVKENVYK